jgi:RimJ/RimL family protein N-acetyltransferase
MSELLSLPTDRPDVAIVELDLVVDARRFFRLIHRNRSQWPDMSALFPDIGSARWFEPYEGQQYFGITQDDALVGVIDLMTTNKRDKHGNWVECWIDTDKQRQGIGTAAGQAIVAHVLRDPHANERLSSSVSTDNVAGLAFAQRLGFTPLRDRHAERYEDQILLRYSS